MKRIVLKLPIGERVFWASRSFTPKEIFLLLARSQRKVRTALAQNPACPTDCLSLLANDESEEVREALAANPACPPGILSQLAQGGKTSILERIAGNPSAPPGLLEEIYKLFKKSQKYWLYPPLAENPSTPASILEELARESGKLEVAVAKNPGAPPELLRKLFYNSAPYLKYRIVQNPSAPLDVLAEAMERMRKYGDEWAEWLAKNPSLPEEFLRSLAKDRKWRVRAEVGRNPSTPRDVLEALARQKQLMVQMGVAANPAAPAEILAGLVGRGWKKVRRVLALNPACPLEVLRELDGREVLENPGLSLEGLIQLILARFERRGRLHYQEAYKLLPFLDLIPKDPPLWLAIWEGLSERGKEIFEGHPEARGMLLLGRLGR